jgi:hypothetical protein
VSILFGSQLTGLSLTGGQGLELGAWLAALPRLAELHVCADPVTIIQDFSCLTALTSASLFLARAPDEANEEASLPASLRQLCITFEGIDWLPAVVTQASGLEKLELGSGVGDFWGLDQLTNLTSLYLSSDVDGVPQELGALRALRQLDFELSEVRSEEELAPLLQLTGVRRALLLPACLWDGHMCGDCKFLQMQPGGHERLMLWRKNAPCDAVAGGVACKAGWHTQTLQLTSRLPSATPTLFAGCRPDLPPAGS